MPTIVPGFYWPPEASGHFEVNDLASVFASVGYEECGDGILEVGYEKLALYEDPDQSLGWSHAARQLSDGRWTSKIGKLWDIIHQTPDAVSGVEYGKVVRFMRRPVETRELDVPPGGTQIESTEETSIQLFALPPSGISRIPCRFR